MLLLTSTSDKIQLTTGSALTVDVHASWLDNASGAITLGRTNTAITTATTTDIVASPASSTQRSVKAITIRNKDVSSDVVTVLHTDGSIAVQLISCTLSAGEELCYDAETGWKHFSTLGGIKFDPYPAIADGHTLANTSGVTASPVDTSLSAYINYVFGFTTGSVVFQGASGLAQDNANFFYSSTNHNLGLGGAAASNWRLAVTGKGATSATFGLVVDNSTTAGCLWVRDDGIVLFPQYGNGALSVSGGSVVSSTLAVTNGGTGVTSSTGTGSNVLSASPTFTGTAAFSAISASAAGNVMGTAGGNVTTPTITNTNIVLYTNSSTNWAGIGVDTGGIMYFVTGITAPATRLTITPSGTANFTGTVGGGSGWNVTAAGAATFNGNLNIGGAYQVSGTTLLSVNGNYTELTDSTGTAQILLGNASDQTSYYRNTLHDFQTRSGGTTLATINSTTVNALGTFTTNALGNQFGTAGGSITSPTTTNTNILLYVVNTTTNWAGIGSDTGGNIYFVVGTGGGGGNPSTRVSINTGGAVRFHNYGAGTLVTDGSGNITASSDIALKENVADYKAGLDEVLNLRPVSFNWTEDSGLDTKDEYVGFVAQEVEPHLPHAIGEDTYGTKTITDRVIIAALVNAVKELSAKVEALEAKGQSE